MLVNLCTAFWFFANLCHFSYVSMSGNKIFSTTVLLGGGRCTIIMVHEAFL